MLQTIDIKLQSQGQPLAPSTEIQRLQIFVGKWNTEGETHASVDAPAVKVAFVDTDEWLSYGSGQSRENPYDSSVRWSAEESYEWLPGGFFLVNNFNAPIGNRLPKLINNSQLVVIPDGPHAINWTHADLVNPLLLDFLKSAN
jgi:hypothetical protein